MARYEIRDATAPELTVLSKHRTRQGALDAWRERWRDRQVVIVRTYADRSPVPVVEGRWVEPQPPE